MPVISTEQAEAFFLIFIRVTAVMITIPVLGDASVPMRVKAGLSLMMAMILFPVMQTYVSNSSFDIFSLVLRMIGEVLIGMAIGFGSRLIFAGIQLAGQLIGFQMGLSIANVIDPANNTQVSVISQFQYLVALLIFLLMDGHHIFIYAIADSIRVLPPLNFHFSGPLLEVLINMMGKMFIVAIKVGAPIVAILFFLSIGMGLVARTVPQINIFVVGFPLQIAVGLIGIGVTIPLFIKIVETCFVDMKTEIGMLLNAM
jgi:flagellar biosynthetic protein FliR